MKIRLFDLQSDMEALRDLLIELQEFERQIDPRMSPGNVMAKGYLTFMLNRCKEHNGKIFISTADGNPVGFVTLLTECDSEEVEKGVFQYAMISDLLVKNEYRGSGHGKALLQAAEQYAITQDVRWLRIGALSGNHKAVGLYSSLGFKELYVEMEKSLK